METYIPIEKDGKIMWLPIEQFIEIQEGSWDYSIMMVDSTGIEYGDRGDLEPNESYILFFPTTWESFGGERLNDFRVKGAEVFDQMYLEEYFVNWEDGDIVEHGESVNNRLLQSFRRFME